MNKREKILTLIEEQMENKNIIKHMFAVEACMRALARRLNADQPATPERSDGGQGGERQNAEEVWGLAGLVHDLDYQEGIPDEEHGTLVGQILEQEGIKLSDQVLHAIAAHNWRMNGVKPKTDMAWALFSVDSLTGLIVATALVMDGKLANVDVENVLNRFDEKSFAAGCRREDILKCEEIGFQLKDFVQINLKAMKNISQELGL